MLQEILDFQPITISGTEITIGEAPRALSRLNEAFTRIGAPSA